ncbi:MULTISPECIES: SPOR domain-containing protein [Sphingomonas]|uniref:SPOR domain-containing protein n=1 Tax=Sphingomonas molluscorum TaxID=418184 RepID=A0ABU8Q7B1_9SPHN|nr:SPOR domain-containing protein [Sphingomonas sp. JUb134]MBM7406976.1 cell division septation protein DedD [Sphingomonas sp. JUb134]
MRAKLFLGTAALLLLGQPAFADVKDGVDAWTRGDFARAVKEWRGPALKGDPDAQFNLAQAYKLGRGVPADLAQAEQWYAKAAAQGHPQAVTNYGLALFQNGRRQEAVKWLEQSAARGEARAQFVLGTMLFNGDAVSKDWVRAYALMTRASSSGLPQASQTLAQMDKYVSLQDRQRGLEMARTIEAQAARAPVTATAVAAAAPTAAAAPARTAAAAPPRTAPAMPAPVRTASAPAPVRTAPAAAATTVAARPATVASPRPATPTAATATSGGWRVQLGAFRESGGAQALWSQVRAKFPGRTPEYVQAGAVTKLLVGPYASSAEATRACSAVKSCLPVKR